MLKILHTGDIHLDSPLSSLDFATAERLRDEHRKIFQKMMQYAIQQDVDIILISGDLFDSKYVTATTKELVINLFKDFAKPIVIAPGNHDPYSLVPLYKNGGFSKNVHVFSSDSLEKIEFDELNLSVFGYAFLTPSLEHSPIAEYSLGLGKNPIRLLCAHAELGVPLSKYAPVTVSDIERFDFSYAALGHVHNRPDISSQRTLINYCGFLFGRSFDELGEGGAYLVTIDDGKTDAERIIFSDHVFVRAELDVSGVTSQAEISQKISDFVSSKGYNKKTSLRLSLVGSVNIELNINTNALEKAEESLCTIEIKDNTTPIPHSTYLENDPSLRGEIYRTLLPKLTSDDLEERKCAAKALSIALCAIDGQSLASIIDINEDNFDGGNQ